MVVLLLTSCVDKNLTEKKTKYTIEILYENGDSESISQVRTYFDKSWYYLSEDGCLIYKSNNKFLFERVACDVRRFNITKKENLLKEEF